jgi:hypothetical protein
MAPLGGLFVSTIGLFVVLGSFSNRARMPLTYVGFGAATLALVLGGRLAVGLPHPAVEQVAALIFAIVLEIIAFVVLMPRARSRGDRAVIVTTLAIVGAHFIIMLPAFGPLIGVLGFLCLVNAAAAWRKLMYPSSAAWLVDGAMKLLLGAILLVTSPLFFVR